MRRLGFYTVLLLAVLGISSCTVGKERSPSVSSPSDFSKDSSSKSAERLDPEALKKSAAQVSAAGSKVSDSITALGDAVADFEYEYSSEADVRARYDSNLNLVGNLIAALEALRDDYDSVGQALDDLNRVIPKGSTGALAETNDGGLVMASGVVGEPLKAPKGIFDMIVMIEGQGPILLKAVDTSLGVSLEPVAQNQSSLGSIFQVAQGFTSSAVAQYREVDLLTPQLRQNVTCMDNKTFLEQVSGKYKKALLAKLAGKVTNTKNTSFSFGTVDSCINTVIAKKADLDKRMKTNIEDYVAEYANNGFGQSLMVYDVYLEAVKECGFNLITSWGFGKITGAVKGQVTKRVTGALVNKGANDLSIAAAKEFTDLLLSVPVGHFVKKPLKAFFLPAKGKTKLCPPGNIAVEEAADASLDRISYLGSAQLKSVTITNSPLPEQNGTFSAAELPGGDAGPYPFDLLIDFEGSNIKIVPASFLEIQDEEGFETSTDIVIANTPWEEIQNNYVGGEHQITVSSTLTTTFNAAELPAPIVQVYEITISFFIKLVDDQEKATGQYVVSQTDKGSGVVQRSTFNFTACDDEFFSREECR